MQDHEGRKVSSEPFPHSNSRNHGERAALYLTDEMLPSIFKPDASSKDESAIAEELLFG